jgi:hypothetical protein
LLKTRPKGPETGANQLVSGKSPFRLTVDLIFGNLVSAAQEIPGFVPDSTARHWRALVFLELNFLPELLRRRRANYSPATEVSAKIL